MTTRPKPGWIRRLAGALSLVALVLLAGGLWFYGRLRASRPQLDGAGHVPQLEAPVQITRDALGVPVVAGASRRDVARGLGWLHGQDRFFQMDLLRRRSAGELAALVGSVALPLDRRTRVHRFRALAARSLARLDPGERALVEAYTEGVNAGLRSLGAKPFEYYLLRETPAPWQPEDSFLVGCAMMLDLEGGDGSYEKSLLTLRDVLGWPAVDFFAPAATPADAALDGTRAPLAKIPGPAVLDLRKAQTSVPRATTIPRLAGDFSPVADDGLVPGSNSFALSGAHTATGGGLLANDMHLHLAVPSVWYRAHLVWPGHRIGGVTLPGTPLVIVGSNGHVAWGFTNACADVSDLVLVTPNPISANLYAAPGHANIMPLKKHHETIAVHGGAAVEVDYDWTIWGPIVGQNGRGQPLALRWIAHEPDALNYTLGRLEDATTVDEAVAVAHQAGIPVQNFVVADAAGNIAWTLAGRLPKRVGFDGRMPVEWYFGDRRWEGWRDPAEIPVVRFSADGASSTSGAAPGGPVAGHGRIWTANQRILGGAAGTMIGDSGYARPARAAQIRDDLAALETAGPAQLLAVQLDDRAVFLRRWQQLLLATLAPGGAAGSNRRGTLRDLVGQWEGRAAVDSVSYRLVRAFRDAVARRTLTPILARCAEADADFSWRHFQCEDALWALLTEKPMHLLDPSYANWEALLAAAADDVAHEIESSHETPARATWGRRNTLRIRHPLSAALPLGLGSWLDLPADQVPGDEDMPRVAGPGFGASERLVVAPGQEAAGILELPGGQSGHPLSPYYRAGFHDWVTGAPTPFLPGATEHALTLAP